MIQQPITNAIQNASKVIGKTWPLYSFVTSNPLSGYEQLHFKEAVLKANQYLHATVFPKPTIFKQALQSGEINQTILADLLLENQLYETPQFYLSQMNDDEVEEKNHNHQLDTILAKWLAAFMDEGLAEWQMPGKKNGFYSAWRKLASYDSSLKIKNKNDIPKTSSAALEIALKDYSADEYQEIFTQHLAALPGWTGYINYRTDVNSSWQKEYPIDLEQYLAVRLWIAKNLKIPFLQKNSSKITNIDAQLKYIWLKAWEKTWQKNLAQIITDAPISKTDDSTPDAQLVFCIDTRSELIRRHVEAQGNYETYGYAGFFGIAMDYTNLQDDITRKSCPPIVGSAYQVSEVASESHQEKMSVFKKKNQVSQFKEYFLKRMKNMLPSTFGFVEISGLFYGFSLVGRTFSSGVLYRRKQKNNNSFETFATPQINCTNAHSHNEGIPIDEKVAIVKSAFDLTGWKNFAPLVIFAGHGSHTANNPFASSLDCGACAASPGRHNARMLATLANLKEVREVLAVKHKLIIPQDTIFIGAEHNTTTDEIEIFDAAVPESHQEKVRQLKVNLKKAQQTATKDRLYIENSVSLAEKKASDWAETRPEWGLAKNAGFIVAPRELTKNTNLHSRCFLHSYDWEKDITGAALEGIMQGPMVVTQWINNHYYFVTVDNKTFGGGSKITHNITGKFGVVQGNGGDLKMGLPLQSICETDSKMYHQPLRLSVFINAPLPRVIDILERNKNLKTLLDNEWIYLMVIDPTENSKIKKYEKNLIWTEFSANIATKTTDSLFQNQENLVEI
jgi:hypothetical protein